MSPNTKTWRQLTKIPLSVLRICELINFKEPKQLLRDQFWAQTTIWHYIYGENNTTGHSWKYTFMICGSVLVLSKSPNEWQAIYLQLRMSNNEWDR